MRLNAPWGELCRVRERISINSTLKKNVVANPQNPNAEIAFIFFQMLSQTISLIFAWRETRGIFNWKRPGCREGAFSPGPRAFNAASWLQPHEGNERQLICFVLVLFQQHSTKDSLITSWSSPSLNMSLKQKPTGPDSKQCTPSY